MTNVDNEMTYLGLFTYKTIGEYISYFGCTFIKDYGVFTAGSTAYKIVLDIETGSLMVYDTAEDYLKNISTEIEPTFIQTQ